MAQTEGQEVSGEQERTSRRRSLAFLKATSTNTKTLSFQQHAWTFVYQANMGCVHFLILRVYHLMTKCFSFTK